jgi:menaquinone-dependent protoporphyrinogen IX oxidase
MHKTLHHPNVFLKCFYLVVALMIILFISFDQSYAAGDTVVVYYSRTGKSEVVAKAIAGHMNADIIQINDTKERSGIRGFIIAAYDSQMDHYTRIEPAAVDFSMYKNIYLVSPIWNWKLSVPMRTLLHTANLQGKKMTMVTTANIDIKKYECFGEDAPFIKKFLRNYLRDNRKGMLRLAKSSHADIMQHFHVATEGLSGEQIEAVAIGKISKSVAANTHAAMAGCN